MNVLLLSCKKMYYRFGLESSKKLQRTLDQKDLYLTIWNYIADDKPSITPLPGYAHLTSYTIYTREFWTYIRIQRTTMAPSCFILVRLLSMFRSTGL